MESNNTNLPNFKEIDWQSNNSSPITLESRRINSHGIIANNSGWNSIPSCFMTEGKQLLEVNLIPNGIEIVYKLIKGGISDLSPLDSITKDIYLIVNGELIFSNSLRGKYVSPKPATYTFDE